MPIDPNFVKFFIVTLRSIQIRIKYEVFEKSNLYKKLKKFEILVELNILIWTNFIFSLKTFILKVLYSVLILPLNALRYSNIENLVDSVNLVYSIN